MYLQYEPEANQLFNFTQDELEENTLGRLSDHQKERLETKLVTDTVFLLLTAVIGAPIIGVVGRDVLGINAWILAGLILFTLIPYTIYRSRATGKRISAGLTESIVDICTFDSMRVSKFGPKLRYIRIGKIPFLELTEDQVNYFVEGNSYCVFYLSMIRSRYIIAVKIVKTH